MCCTATAGVLAHLRTLRRHGGVELTITETVLVFVGIPAAVIAIIYGLVYGGSAARSKRYRPGRPFNPTPVWFVANKQTVGTGASSSGREVGAGSPAHALSGGTESAGTADGTAATADSTGATTTGHSDGSNLSTVGYGETGGASDSW
jgi:hypothetical protein